MKNEWMNERVYMHYMKKMLRPGERAMSSLQDQRCGWSFVCSQRERRKLRRPQMLRVPRERHSRRRTDSSSDLNCTVSGWESMAASTPATNMGQSMTLTKDLRGSETVSRTSRSFSSSIFLATRRISDMDTYEAVEVGENET